MLVLVPMFKAHWYNGKKGKIEPEMINGLRMGDYRKADKKTRELWEVMGLHVIPGVESNYKGKVQKKVLLSDAVTVGQEALAWLFLKVCYDEWVEEWKKQENNSGGPPEKKAKPKGENFSSKWIEEYKEIQQKVHTQRQEVMTGKEWDEAIRAKAAGGDKNKATGDKAGGAAKKEKVIIPILDDPSWNFESV